MKLTKVGEDHHAEPQHRGHGAGHECAADMSQSGRNRLGMRRVMPQFLFIARNKKQAEIGSRAEQNHHDEDLGSGKHLDLGPMKTGHAGQLSQQGHDAGRHQQRNQQRDEWHDHKQRSAINAGQEQNDHHHRDEFGVLDARRC